MVALRACGICRLFIWEGSVKTRIIAAVVASLALMVFASTAGTSITIAQAPAGQPTPGYVSSASSSAATLSLRATMGVASTLLRCPPDVPSDGTDCRARTEQGRVPGLGSVSAAYIWSYRLGPPTCPSELATPLATTGRLTVAGRESSSSRSRREPRAWISSPFGTAAEFTITGGTGIYAGASGSGTVQRSIGMSRGSETWIGTLVAPGVEFDVTAPMLSGATSKTVRAPRGDKRVRMTCTVTGSDAVTAPSRQTARRSRAASTSSAAQRSPVRQPTRAEIRKRRSSPSSSNAASTARRSRAS